MELYPSETRILFDGLTLWLEMAEKRLELMERELDEGTSAEDDRAVRRTKVGINKPSLLLSSRDYIVI